MEMLDVIRKLQEITTKSPEVAKAIDSVTKTNPTEVAPPGREKQVRALKGKVDNPYAVAWSSYNKSKGKKEAIGDELADEGGFKDIDTANKEKARLYALLKQKKELLKDREVNKDAPKEKENITTKEDSPADSPFTKTTNPHPDPKRK